MLSVTWEPATKIIAFDAHIDTVGIGNIDNWNLIHMTDMKPETEIGGRGVSDQCGGIVSAVYGAKIMKDLDLIPEGYKDHGSWYCSGRRL